MSANFLASGWETVGGATALTLPGLEGSVLDDMFSKKARQRRKKGKRERSSEATTTITDAAMEIRTPSVLVDWKRIHRKSRIHLWKRIQRRNTSNLALLVGIGKSFPSSEFK